MRQKLPHPLFDPDSPLGHLSLERPGQDHGRPSCSPGHGVILKNSAWIWTPYAPARPGPPDGALHGVHPQALFAGCLTALAERTGFDPAEVDDVIAGKRHPVR